jgi:hypothetical protein
MLCNKNFLFLKQIMVVHYIKYKLKEIFFHILTAFHQF